MVLALSGWWLLGAVQQESGARQLVSIVNRLPESEQIKPIACTRAPLADGPDRVALLEIAPRLAQPAQRATAYCLLGDTPSALEAYQQAASAGNDGWAALQVYFLQAQGGNMQAAKDALQGAALSKTDLLDFTNSVVALKLPVDLLPLAQRIAGLNPGDPDSWKLWLNAAQAYEAATNWQAALDAYLAGILAQEKAGVKFGRSSFELRAGRIYQTQLRPTDLKAALSHYNTAIDGGDFQETYELSAAYLYRGEVYQGLKPAYTPLQALQEYNRALDLNPASYWAMRAIASVYLWDLKNYPLAENYIDQAIHQSPDLPYAYLTRGDVRRQEGDLANAVLDYQAALARQPGWQTAIDRISAVEAELKKQAP